MDNPFNESDESFFESEASAPHALVSAPDASTPASPATSDLATDSAASQRDERSSVVAARGTAEGLVLRIDGRVSAPDLHAAVRDFLESRRSFLAGHDVAFEWIGRKPEDSVIQELTSFMSSEFSISVRSSQLRTTAPKQPTTVATAAPAAHPTQPGLSIVGGLSRAASSRQEAYEPGHLDKQMGKSLSLFDGIDGLHSRSSGSNSMLWDDPDARIIYGTLRSGQKVETEHSIVVFGDVNSGAEVIAGGDIVILGTLRGIAHAGAYDESGGGRVIFSLNLQPTQLRIGLVISRGGGGERTESTPRGGAPEIARVENNMIVVEPYQSRTVWARRRE